ncbi:MAG: 30S ribosomal protein S18 [Planctomycetota bacterium]
MSHSRRPPPPPITGKNCDDPALDYKDVANLRRFLTAHGQLLSRKRTGYCAQCQKQLKAAVKRARHLALLPYVA